MEYLHNKEAGSGCSPIEAKQDAGATFKKYPVGQQERSKPLRLAPTKKSVEFECTLIISGVKYDLSSW